MANGRNQQCAHLKVLHKWTTSHQSFVVQSINQDCRRDGLEIEVASQGSVSRGLLIEFLHAISKRTFHTFSI